MEGESAVKEYLSPESLQARIRAAREERNPDAQASVVIPGYKGLLVGKYKPIPWRVRRAMLEDAESVVDPIERELVTSADTLAAASVTIEAHIDGEVTDLGVKLGLGLASYLELAEGVDSDRQGVFIVLPDETDLIEHTGEVILALRKAQGQVDERIVGESNAAS